MDQGLPGGCVAANHSLGQVFLFLTLRTPEGGGLGQEIFYAGKKHGILLYGFLCK